MLMRAAIIKGIGKIHKTGIMDVLQKMKFQGYLQEALRFRGYRYEICDNGNDVVFVVPLDLKDFQKNEAQQNELSYISLYVFKDTEMLFLDDLYRGYRATQSIKYPHPFTVDSNYYIEQCDFLRSSSKRTPSSDIFQKGFKWGMDVLL